MKDYTPGFPQAILRRIEWLICGLLFSCTVLAANPVTDGTGTLLGADNVLINGTVYDVRFGGVTCISEFSGCDAQSDFVFHNQSDAVDASQALLDQVLLDYAAPDTFDSDPETNVGCSNSGICRIFTPYQIDDVNFQAVGVTADNLSIPGSPDVVTTNVAVGVAQDLSAVTLATFAIWTVDAEVPVPPFVPFVLLLLFTVLYRSNAR